MVLKFVQSFCFLIVVAGWITGCGGKYSVKSFPAGAKVYLRDIQTKEKKLIGMTPIQMKEDSRLGNVFFIEFEKDAYKNKEVMVKVNEGESMTVSARLDPMSEEELANVAKNDQNDDEKKDQPQQQQPKDDKKKKPEQLAEDMKELKDLLSDLKLRVALLENTTSIQKEAIFSARFKGGPAGYDRDRQDQIVGLIFDSQQAILKGDYRTAKTNLERAIEQDEYYSQAWLLKGSIAYLEKDLPTAKRAWERTLKLDPYNKAAYRYLTEVYKRLGIQELPRKASEARTPASQVEIERRINIPEKAIQ